MQYSKTSLHSQTLFYYTHWLSPRQIKAQSYKTTSCLSVCCNTWLQQSIKYTDCCPKEAKIHQPISHLLREKFEKAITYARQEASNMGFDGPKQEVYFRI